MEFVWVDEAAKKSKAFADIKYISHEGLEAVWEPGANVIECEVVDVKTKANLLTNHRYGR